jgi:hypothetical protein
MFTDLHAQIFYQDENTKANQDSIAWFSDTRIQSLQSHQPRPIAQIRVAFYRSIIWGSDAGYIEGSVVRTEKARSNSSAASNSDTQEAQNRK